MISVSGGGEICPNTACRAGCIKLLTEKGYEVYYEQMIVMPSNCLIPTPDPVVIRLLEMLPSKVDHILDDLISGTRRRTKPFWLDRLFCYAAKLEKTGARLYGKKLSTNNNCSGCSLCEENCPVGNITLQNNRPLFSNNCILCLKCIYRCPCKAIEPGFFKSFVLKNGYNIDGIIKRAERIEPGPVEEPAKGFLWKGVRQYLNDRED